MRRFLALVALATAACTTGDGLGEREVRLSLPDQQVDDLEIDGCARDGDVVVLGASRADVLLQVLLQLGDDDEVDVDSSGITVTIGNRGTLGAGDGELIGSETGAAGTIEEATVRGDRIDVVAEAVPTTEGTQLAAGRLELSARCSPQDDLAVG
ncbi:MAG: hypothetical protein ACLGIC_06690 [Acidimicrobiia bacterium]